MVREFRGKVNDLLLVDDLKLFGKTVQELDSLEQTVRFLSSDLGVQFWISKCSMLEIERFKVVQSITK